MQWKALFGILIMVALTAAGCAQFHTRMFATASNSQDIYIDRYRVFPRLVVFKDVFGKKYDVYDHGYWASLKVYDTSVIVNAVPPAQADPELRSAEGDRFLQTTLSRLSVDSLLIYPYPTEEQFAVPIDTSRYTPRDVNYLSFNFGKVDIPIETYKLDGTFFYRITGFNGATEEAGTVTFTMTKVEEHVLPPVSALDAVFQYISDDD